jgi:hypothetical protein
MQTKRKSSLSPAWRRLIDLMLEIAYGSIEDLQVRDGQPVFDPPPQINRLRVFGCKNGPHAKGSLRDFVLNEQFVWLLDEIGTGTMTVRTITIQDGLPIRVLVGGVCR